MYLLLHLLDIVFDFFILKPTTKTQPKKLLQVTTLSVVNHIYWSISQNDPLIMHILPTIQLFAGWNFEKKSWKSWKSAYRDMSRSTVNSWYCASHSVVGCQPYLLINITKWSPYHTDSPKYSIICWWNFEKSQILLSRSTDFLWYRDITTFTEKPYTKYQFIKFSIR